MSDRAAGPIAARWARLRAAGRPALITYITAGYPSADATADALGMLEETGADFIEVGIPFSDPLADGPTIQHSSFEALQGGMTVRGVLDIVREARAAVPIVLFSYLNPILRYGVTRFLDDARQAGAAGVLLTDLPVGGDPDVEGAIRESGLDRVPLVALTTTETRLREAVAGGGGFVYLISRLGVTGGETTIGDAVRDRVAQLRAVTRLPVAVGFGIGTGAQASAVAEFADGVVVGSALVRALGESGARARALVGELRQALDAVAVAP